jgi:hypothetical protein
MSKTKTLGAWLFAMVIAALPICGQQATPPQSDTHFGLKLPPKILTLWNEVAEGYGKPIQEREIRLSETRNYGYSDIEDDGTPFIALSQRGHSIEEVVHELMHLKLRLEGYPFQIYWTYHCRQHKVWQEWLSGNLKDVIEHWVFYPRVLALGIQPDPEASKDIERAVQEDRWPGGDTLTRQELAVFYFRAFTLPSNAEVCDKISAWYKAKGWTEAMALGDQMLQILTTIRPRNANEEVTTFLQCANVLFKGEIDFRDKGWTDLSMGAVVVRRLNIEMLPLVPCSP